MLVILLTAVQFAATGIMGIYFYRQLRKERTREDTDRRHSPRETERLRQLRAIRLSEPLTVDEIADHVKVSKYYFCQEFHKETGYTVVKFINNLRCREAEKLLRGSEYTVSEIARMCGFENLSYFTRTFKSIVGCTPSALRM